MKGRAQFMRDVGGQVAALMVGPFEFADHVIEAPRKMAKLAGVMFRYPNREITFRDGIDRREYVRHGTTEAPKGEIADQRGKEDK